MGRIHLNPNLQAKILPLRLYVDQDALDFLKKFFSFKDPDAAPSTSEGEDIYFRKILSLSKTFGSS